VHNYTHHTLVQNQFSKEGSRRAKAIDPPLHQTENERWWLAKTTHYAPCVCTERLIIGLPLGIPVLFVKLNVIYKIFELRCSSILSFVLDQTFCTTFVLAKLDLPLCVV